MAQAIKRLKIETGLQTGGLGLALRPFARALEIAASGLTVVEAGARVEREPGRQADAARARKLARLDRHRILALNDGQALAPLTDDQARTLKSAEAIEAAARAMLALDRDRTTVAQRKAARGKIGEAYTLRTGVERDRQDALATRQDDLRLAEAAALDALREDDEPGSQIERRRGQTQVRMRSRDGLKLLHESGALTPRDDDGAVRRDQSARAEADRLLSIGLRYRDRYEMAAASLKSCLGSSDRVAVKRDTYAEARAAQRRAALNGKVREWDILVSVQGGPDALLALRMIAGEARTVNSITTAARRRDRLKCALATALGIIADRVEKDR